MKAVLSLLTVFLLVYSTLSQSTAVVTSDKANLRGTPSVNGKVIDKLKKDVEVEILTQMGAWYLVQGPDYVGWLHGDTIRLNPPDVVTTSSGKSSPVLLVAPTTAPEKVVRIGQPKPSKPASSDNRTYYKGPRGGCYYLSGSKKVYVDHSYCN